LGIFSVLLFLSFCLVSYFSENNPKVVAFLPRFQKGKPTQTLYLRSAQTFSAESPEFLLAQKSTLLASAPPVMVTSQVLGQILGEVVFGQLLKNLIFL